MNVIFVSRSTAKQLCVTQDTKLSFLSISDTIEEMNEMADLSVIRPSLYLNFLDVDDEIDGMNEQHALSIINFVENAFKIKKDIVVHCFAGISRSGAVAKWINDHYGLDNFYLNDYKVYNKHIYNMLMNLTSGLIDNSNSMFNLPK